VSRAILRSLLAILEPYQTQISWTTFTYRKAGYACLQTPLISLIRLNAAQHQQHQQHNLDDCHVPCGVSRRHFSLPLVVLFDFWIIWVKHWHFFSLFCFLREFPLDLSRFSLFRPADEKHTAFFLSVLGNFFVVHIPPFFEPRVVG
jgi:hypothetical protein